MTNWRSCRRSPVDDVVRSTVLVEIHGQPFSPWQELDAWSRDAAAMSVFLGKVRGTALDGGDLEALEVEHYAGLCERCIESSARQLLIEHGASAAMVLHRVGRLRRIDVDLPSAAVQPCLRRSSTTHRSGSASGGTVKASGSKAIHRFDRQLSDG